jgi:starch synthase (maltosyl-transferring)
LTAGDGGAVPVLFVIRHMNMGGAQRQLAHLAAGLDRSRFRPAVACLHRDEPLLVGLRSRGVETFLLPARRGVDPTLPWRLARTAQEHRTTILHSFLFAGNAWGRMAARLAGVPIAIASERTDSPRRRKREILVERLLAPLTQAYIVNSAAVGRTLAAQIPAAAGRISCIPNGIDLEAFDVDRDAARAALRGALGAGEEDRLVGIVGNLTPDKAHRDLLEAVARLGATRRSVRLVLLGEGALRPDIERQAERLGLAPRVHLLGLRQDVPSLLSGLDLLVQASVREGMPNAVLEGMAAGLPIVATNVGGTAEALAEGACGVLIPSSDPETLSSALGSLLADPGRAARLAAAARRRVEDRYSLPRMIADTEALYDRLLAAV